MLSRSSRPSPLGEPVERVIVIDHGLAVAAELHIDLDAVTGGDRGADCARGVFDRTMRRIVQGAMRNRPRSEPIQ